MLFIFSFRILFSLHFSVGIVVFFSNQRKRDNIDLFEGYKGIVAVRLEIDQSIKLTFANMHLTADEGKREERCKIWSNFQQTYESTFAKDAFLFAFGDQNWRTSNDLTVNEILNLISTKDYETILKYDEVIKMNSLMGKDQ